MLVQAETCKSVSNEIICSFCLEMESSPLTSKQQWLSSFRAPSFNTLWIRLLFGWACFLRSAGLWSDLAGRVLGLLFTQRILFRILHGEQLMMLQVRTCRPAFTPTVCRSGDAASASPSGVTAPVWEELKRGGLCSKNFINLYITMNGWS